MNELIQTRVKALLNEVLEMSVSFDEMSLNTDLRQFGVNSMGFIKLIVAIEEAFGFEFRDEDLLMDNFKTLEGLIHYIEHRLSI